MPNLGQLLSSKSSAEHKRIFLLCREISSELVGSGVIEGVYAVGGVVRDLVLDRKAGDVDISVVGDALAFSNALAAKLGLGKPVESQFLTFKITGDADGTVVDIVTARSETYPEAAALPEVTPSSIEDDLRRRDFTVNSMGISISDATWGTLIDPAGGFGDIMRKRIRVLHDSSFVDDPTRIFRAVRYATRLGFSIDSRTEELIGKSLGNVDRLSGARLRNEFEPMLAEPERVAILRKSEELGLLGAISPGLRIGTRSLQVLEDLPADPTGSSDANSIENLLALTTYGLSEEEAAQTATRFDGPSSWTDAIIGGPRLTKLVQVLDQPDIQRSEVADILSPIPLPAIRAYIAAGPPLPRRDRMVEYIDKIRFVKPEITGDDLLAIGIPQGPVIGQLIDLVKRARLDGRVSTKEEELKLAKSRLPGFLNDR